MMNPADAFRMSWEQSFHRFADVVAIHPLGGGSINSVYKVETTDGQFVMKMNSLSRYPGMFKGEAAGLQLIMDTKSVSVPGIVAVTALKQHQVLILEYIEPAPRIKHFYSHFGEQLAAMHRHTSETFGLSFNNYIGSLPQNNKQEKSLYDFFIQHRIEPQLRLAVRKELLNDRDEKDFEDLFKKLEHLLPDEHPSLIHGDLWNGNYITGNDGKAWLIDPAVSYSSREADIAMTKLFGGFEPEFYSAYHEVFPLIDGWEQRLDLWNLYPLLVHVNLFGGHYVQEVRSIVKNYIR
ncbi:MAG: fructosamine kinase family protein [Bacteroidetes bacterium]|nr:fructosamine kinase family protein [Bacteroidota bacterium]